MTDLSPASQAILDAITEWEVEPDSHSRQIAIATLYALASRIKGADDIRQDVLDANELENTENEAT
jgi:hypothetical protein